MGGHKSKPENSATLSRLFYEMAKVFSSQFKHMPEKNGKSYTLVLGPTGVGKSLLIGYLAGQKIVKKTVQTGGTSKRARKVLGYELETQDNRPKLGHLSVKTKGAPVYENYIDTAEFPFTSNQCIERQIWNAVALQLAVARYQPNRVIVLLSDIDSSRDGTFFERIKTLNHIFDHSSGKTCWANTLFVMTNKFSKLDPDDMRDQIEEGLEVLNADKATQSNNMELIEALHQIKAHSDIIIADFLTGQTREDVIKWLTKTPSQVEGLADNFNALNLIPGCERKLKTALDAARLYFEELEYRKEHYEGRVALLEEYVSLSLEDLAIQLTQRKITQLKKMLREQKANGNILSKEISKLNSNKSPAEWYVIEQMRNQLKRIEDDIQFLEDFIDAVTTIESELDKSSSKEEVKEKIDAWKTTEKQKYQEICERLDCYVNFRQLLKKETS